MELYKSFSGKSGVDSYENGPDYIIVKFSTGAIYTYTNKSAGAENITHMKQLAQKGEGLNSFINKNVKNLYERKEC